MENSRNFISESKTPEDRKLLWQIFIMSIEQEQFILETHESKIHLQKTNPLLQEQPSDG